MKKVVIIGGMAAGCKTATRLKRLKPDFEVTIIEKKPFVSFGTCGMPFYASGDVEDFMSLATTPWDMVRDEEFFKNVKDVNVLTNYEVIKLEHSKKCAVIKNLKTEAESVLEYDYLVFATGAKPVEPPFPCPKSEKILDFHNPLNAKKFKEQAQTGKIGKVIIIGGGFIGVELAEAMVSLWGIETHLIEMTKCLLPQSLDMEMSELLVKTLQNEDINVYLNTSVNAIKLDDGDNPVVALNNGEEIECDMVFTCIGVSPNTALAESIGVLKGNLGGIKVDGQMKTNVPDVWAAGDCINIWDLITGGEAFFPLGSLANRQGKAVAESIAGLKTEFMGAVGTSSVKVFGFTVASAGLNESTTKKKNIEYSCIWGTFYDRPDYMPESKILFSKLIYEKSTFRLLGLQLAGRGEVSRYIDVFSVLSSKHCTVNDLIDFEHAYTPTHSNPMNPLNFLGAMAVSQEIDGIICVNPKEIDTFTGQILDVREQSEIQSEKCHGNVIETSIADYRNIVKGLKKDIPVLVVCQKGPRAYEAARYCVSIGFKDVKYLGGGMQLARQMLDRTD
ncbi:MAG: FAD-dependent oxidoreductase [bacterium]